MQDLRSLTDDQLAELHASGDEATQAAILHECARRDRKDAQTAKDKARWAAVYEQWYLFAHAQFLAAEDVCRGNLVNREGQRADVQPWELWTGSTSHARRYASEELLEFWEANQRVTVSAFREAIRASARAEREAAGL